MWYGAPLGLNVWKSPKKPRLAGLLYAIELPLPPSVESLTTSRALSPFMSTILHSVPNSELSIVADMRVVPVSVKLPAPSFRSSTSRGRLFGLSA
jgi:hypothetical protein